VIDPIALGELFPDWKERGAPLETPVREDRFLVLTRDKARRVPNWLLPPLMNNHGMFIASLGHLVRWLGARAEELGVDVFAGFAAAEVLYDANGAVKGVATGDMGVGKDGQPKDSYAPGMELHAKYTFFAEGCRGSLSQQLMGRYNLRDGVDPQVYGIGVKELWQVPKDRHRPGLVIHSQGWPLPNDVGGGSFLYHFGDDLVSVGFVTHLSYANPHLAPFEEMQRFKTHPEIRGHFEGGKRIGYGARAINEGGLQSIPRLSFPGGALIGCSAGFVNLPRIKGSHNAMKTGMLAAEAAFAALGRGRANDELVEYPEAFRASWAYRDLYKVRNVKPGLKWGLWPGTVHGGLHMWANDLGLGGVVGWTLRHRQTDHAALRPAADMPRIEYPKPDGVLTFDRLSSVFVSGTTHEEDQPVHLRLRNASIPVEVNLARYDGPEALYCPAAVYEFVDAAEGGKRLQINAQNCVHCKTCDIKDPLQNIVWVTPEGSGGPNYSAM
jgi:electron-transferring-flavoprotein dehydrogenase